MSNICNWFDLSLLLGKPLQISEKLPPSELNDKFLYLNFIKCYQLGER